MAYTLLQTVAIGNGGAAAIEFTNIPASGKDLLCLISTRMETDAGGNLDFLINNDTSANYTWRYLRGSGSAVISSNASAQTRGIIEEGNTGTGDTANTFSNTSLYVSNYAGSTTKTITVDMVNENNASEAFQVLQGFNYASSSAVSSIKFYLNGGADLAQYSTASLYVIDTADATGATVTQVNPKATGGTIFLESGYFYHRFTTSGTFVPSQNVTCDYIIVGGGGAAGGVSVNDIGGGGGGGAVYTSLPYSGLTQQSSYSAIASTSYSVTVGTAGLGITAEPGGGNGGSSSVFGYTAIGGGGGGYGPNNGANGGSGGGGGSSGSQTSGGSGTSGQGKNGGSGGVGNYFSAGGGGGATVAGGNNSGNTSGAGGDGVNLNVINIGYVAGGGYGSRNTSGNGGVFGTNGQGGGSGSYGGGGLGGTRRSSGSSPGNNGAPGIVIIRYSAT